MHPYAKSECILPLSQEKKPYMNLFLPSFVFCQQLLELTEPFQEDESGWALKEEKNAARNFRFIKIWEMPRIPFTD